MSKRKIAFYGGTFNPIHNAHLQLAQSAIDTLNVDQVIFIPAGKPPLKQANELVSGQHRLNMVTLATAGRPKFRVCDHEALQERVTFSIDTIEAIAPQWPDSDFYFLMGDDGLDKLHHWKGFDRLCSRVTFACAPRKDVALSTYDARINLTFLPMPRRAISSTEVRRRIQQALPLRGFVPDAVEEYIAKHHLYSNSRLHKPIDQRSPAERLLTVEQSLSRNKHRVILWQGNTASTLLATISQRLNPNTSFVLNICKKKRERFSVLAKALNWNVLDAVVTQRNSSKSLYQIHGAIPTRSTLFYAGDLLNCKEQHIRLEVEIDNGLEMYHSQAVGELDMAESEIEALRDFLHLPESNC